jgi:hypothetical protein
MKTHLLKNIEKQLAGPKLLPYVNITSVDEYFSLPSEQRERWGLYRKPLSLPCEWLSTRTGAKVGTIKADKKGWKSWNKEIKSRYPIQWFFREWFFSWENPVYALIKGIYFDYREKKYTVKRFFNPFFPRFRKCLPRHTYSDISEAIRKVNFALVLDFWHEEIVDGLVDWNDTEGHRSFISGMKKAVKYIEQERPKLVSQADAALTVATNKKKGTFEQRYAKHDAIEKKIDEKDTELLVWVMQQREMFWT